MSSIIRGSDDFDTANAVVEDASGNVGIGVVPEAWHSSYTALQFAGNGALSGWGNQQAGAAIFVSQNAAVDQATGWKYISTDEASRHEQVNGIHTFSVAPSGTADSAISWTTAMTIANNGDVDIGVFSSSGATTGVLFGVGGGASAPEIGSSAVGTADRFHYEFYNDNGKVGGIKTNGSSTSYNTSSDYRLKELDVPMTGATERVKALRPINFAWKSDGSRVDGFYAHELQAVVPEAATGTKDAMKNEEYEVTPATETTAAVMGTRSVPDMQGIDQSKLVPLLTATIQELIARIEVLEGV